MNKENVQLWLSRIFKHEKGYSSNPADPGNWTGGKVGKGKLLGTKFGIAANTYPDLDIKNLTIQDATEIYIRDFLKPLKAETYHDGVAYQLLDLAAHSGVVRAKRLLQRALHVKQDGIIGPKTLGRMKEYTEAGMIMLIIAARIDFMSDLSVWKTFSRGWMKRMVENLKYGAVDLRTED